MSLGSDRRERCLRRGFLARAAAVGLSAAVLAFLGHTFSAVPAPARAEGLVDAMELQLLDLTNTDRRQRGLTPLELDPALIEIARTRASLQLSQAALSHYDSSGELAVVAALRGSGVEYLLAGENLARWVASDPAATERVEQALMDSPSHRNNILEPSFNRLAVGAATDAAGGVVFAEIFRAKP